MIRKIIRLLEKYEDEIMENTLGGSMDEDDERYAEVCQLPTSLKA